MATKTNLKPVEDSYVSGAAGDDEVGSVFEYSMPLSEQERPPVLPIGEYAATVTDMEKKFGKDSGRPYFNIKLKVEPEAMPPDFVEALGTGQPLTLFSMVMGAEDNPQSRYTMRQFCEALGVPAVSRFTKADFLNKDCRVQIKHGKDLSGNPRAEVQKIIRPA
jgi:hypothetical protein